MWEGPDTDRAVLAVRGGLGALGGPSHVSLATSPAPHAWGGRGALAVRPGRDRIW